MLRLQVSVVAFVSPVRGFSVRVVGAEPVVSVHQHVGRLTWKACLLQPRVGVVLRQSGGLGEMRPDFGVDGVLVVTVVLFSWQAAVRRVLLDVVLDLVELLTSVVHRVFFRGSCGERGGGVDRGGAGALFASMAHTPQEHRRQGQNPDRRHNGNQQWHQVVY